MDAKDYSIPTMAYINTSMSWTTVMETTFSAVFKIVRKKYWRKDEVKKENTLSLLPNLNHIDEQFVTHGIKSPRNKYMVT